MNSFRDRLKEFFNSNSYFLQNEYPGINLNRIISEFEDFHQQEEVHFNQFINALKQGISLSYISQKCFFYNSIFKINRHALIPRYETELLVEMAIAKLKENNYKSICDVGIGPGTILFSILKDSPYPLECMGIDISEEVLLLATENLKLLKNEFKNIHDVLLIQSDRLNLAKRKFDLIVSNPPYIKESDKKKMHHQVISYEPHIALFLKDEEFENWFETFFGQVKDHLNKDGLFLMEGHEDHLLSLYLIAKKYFKEVEIIKDLTQRDRFLRASI